ncbi:MAG TPA: alpha/beta hydrolase [Mycobacteriales bacterium]|nr:alpha/beta hydrolase [Mycobacteriales bacterium]
MDDVSSFAGHDGTRLAYRTVGSGPLLLCVPGGPGRASSYLEDLGGLAAHRTLVLLDSRGTGASDLPADDFSYTAESLAEDVDALRAHLGLETADVLGHSAGAKVAQVWAARHPDRVGRLVLLTSYLDVSDPSLGEDRARVRAARAAEPWYAAARDAEDGMRYAPKGEQKRLEREQRPFFYGRWTEREQEHAASADHQTAPRASSRFQTTTPPEELRAGLGALTAPVLVVTGERDGLTPPLAGRRIHEAIPGSAYAEIAGAGHFPWVDEPEGFLAAVLPFLSGDR